MFERIYAFMQEKGKIIFSISIALNFALTIGIGLKINVKIDKEISEISKINSSMNSETNKTESIISDTITELKNTTTINNEENNKRVNLSVKSINVNDDDKKLLVDYMTTYLNEKQKIIQSYQEKLDILYSKKIENSSTDYNDPVNRMISDFESLKLSEEIARSIMESNLFYFYDAERK